MLKKEKIEKVLLGILIVVLCYSICYSIYGVRNPLAPSSHLITSPVDIITFQKIEKYQYTLKNIFKDVLNEHERSY